MLLVKGIWKNSKRGFPRGIVEKGEDPVACAVREVWEEIKYNAAIRINKDLFVESVRGEHIQKLFIIPDVSDESKFQPAEREIGDLRWFVIESLTLSRERPELVPIIEGIRKRVAENPQRATAIARRARLSFDTRFWISFSPRKTRGSRRDYSPLK